MTEYRYMSIGTQSLQGGPLGLRIAVGKRAKYEFIPLTDLEVLRLIEQASGAMRMRAEGESRS